MAKPIFKICYYVNNFHSWSIRTNFAILIYFNAALFECLATLKFHKVFNLTKLPFIKYHSVDNFILQWWVNYFIYVARGKFADLLKKIPPKIILQLYFKSKYKSQKNKNFRQEKVKPQKVIYEGNRKKCIIYGNEWGLPYILKKWAGLCITL